MKPFINKYLLHRLVILSLGFLWFYGVPGYAQTALAQSSSSPALITSQGKREPKQTAAQSNLQDVLPQLKRSQIIYLGETHDNLKDHQVQLSIIQSLHRHQPKVAIALEMFQRPYQQFLDQYIAGEITEQQLIEKTEYNQRWGFPWEYYAPILRFARANKLPVLAINVPSEITRQVAREGLASLTPQQQRFIPPITEIRTDNIEYRRLLQEAFVQHQQAGHGSSAGFENFFLAQVLWDETMAQNIAQFHQEQPDYQIVVLAGQGHIIYGYGIPSRVTRRLAKNVVQRSVLLSPPDEVQPNKYVADFIIDSSKAE